MIAVDSSALVEIALDAAHATACMEALTAADRVIISAGTLTETLIVCGGRGAGDEAAALFATVDFEVIPLTESRARAAADAYFRYGKKWHAASLNFGESFAYALAKEHDCPLLFVGDDFPLTDVKSVLA